MSLRLGRLLRAAHSRFVTGAAMQGQNAQIWYSIYPMLKSATAAFTSTPQSKQPCQWKNNNRIIFIVIE